ncbi:hypothetical protein OG552_08345 [Streptomyces sp. NBC_01476]|uniref:hypothetical protein n=1 Tax=Streptomyces sp. NBC_01476 TaxID=2903881 RepID=UPI002E31BAA2|nr:hypothetical protein [Streptomyces sp. NBC_01476]
MAKNKNNQNRQRDQREQRSGGQGAEPQETERGMMTEEQHGMPAATQAPRKQKQRFGHN